MTECPLLSRGICETLRDLEPSLLFGITKMTMVEGDGVVAAVQGACRNLERLLRDTHLVGVVAHDEAVGRCRVTLAHGDVPYTVGPTTFIQSHTALNRDVVAEVTSWLIDSPEGPLVDLYAGAGNFALPLAIAGRRVVAVEGHPDTVEDGRHTASLCGADSLVMVRADVDTWLRVDAHASPYAGAVVDPPRAGLSATVREYLAARGPDRLAYVSCDPATLARDLRLLAPPYEVEALQLVDFFPHTPHIETMVLLVRRGSSP